MIRILAIALMIFVATPVKAQENLLAIDLAEDHVDITTGFNGVNLILFGVQDEPGDIAITITGPAKETIVRRKEKTFALWMNRSYARFDQVPAYYRMASSKNIEHVAPFDVRKEHYIGLDTLRFKAIDEEADNIKLFQEAMIRNKQTQGLYPEEAEHIEFIDEHFFRTGFYIPANAPVGEYVIKTHLIQNGVVKDIKTTEVVVAQVGTSAAIYNFAQHWSMAYGLMCVLFALSAGWFSTIIRQRLR